MIPSTAPEAVLAADFDQHPAIAIWETTRACALKCVHCRADAMTQRSPGELNTAEAYALMDQLAACGKPLVVLTGGDPMKRADLEDIVGFASSRGLRIAVTPSATPDVTLERLRALRARGLACLAVSLDGSDEASHDAFRGVPGSFRRTLEIVAWAELLGIPIQINTSVTRRNFDELERIGRLVSRWDLSLWSVFFVVPVGRAGREDLPEAEQFEKAFATMRRVASESRFRVKSTEAPHYRRYALQHGGTPPGRGVNDGRGFVFISHTGDICPSGFLPVPAGNVRSSSVGEIYRDSPLFRQLRDADQLQGKCGACPYRKVCGGSRARAYALTGDWMASDPSCAFVPPGFHLS